ncbi:MAG TPA: tyrosine-type recombinase/integrase [Acetobacteraceae bacterium]|nr:tyrosine-type recombinase/integrase [Acetobacteraceae bacterium]
MPQKKLTQLAVDEIAAPKAGRVEYFDKNLPGFGLRIADSGHKSWVVMYRLPGNPKIRRYTIAFAKFPKVADARDEARRIMQKAEHGEDPAKVEAPKQRDTVKRLVEQFIDRYAKTRNRSWEQIKQLLDRHIVSRWGDREAASITGRDVRELLDELNNKGSPIASNRTLAHGRKMYNWAVAEEILATNPFAGVQPRGTETERDRVLQDDELIRLWRAADRKGGTVGGFLKMLILTAQRRDEVAGMRWVDIDFDRTVVEAQDEREIEVGKAVVWTLPREMTKGDRSHEVPLSPQAVAVLKSLPRIGEYVFGARRPRRKMGQAAADQFTDRDRPISGYTKIKEAIESKLAELATEAAGEGEEAQAMADWRFHDLRRSAATGMARLGVATSTISRVLNHKEGGVTKIYNRYSFLREKQVALERWGRRVQSLTSPAPDNVVELRAAELVA